MRTSRVLVCLGAMLLSRSLSATSARTIHPELVGLRTFALNFSPQTVPGLNADELEHEIRQRLSAAGLAVDESAPTVLFVQIRYRALPSCPDFLLVQTHVAISENVELKRTKPIDPVYVDIWETDDEFIEPTGKAAEIARDSALRIIDYVVESQKYTESVVEKQR